MKLTKWVLLGVAGLALVFLPRRSSPNPKANHTKANHDKSNSPLYKDASTPMMKETAIENNADDHNKTAD